MSGDAGAYALTQLEQWRSRAEKYQAEAHLLTEERDAAVAERDEWKARFEGSWAAMRKVVAEGPEAKCDALRAALAKVLDQRSLLCTAVGKRPCGQCSICEARRLLGGPE